MINKQNFYIGAAFLCLGLIIVPVNDALAKVLSSDLNIMEVIWSRFFGHFVFLVPIALFIHGKNKFINKETNQQIIRGFLIFIGTALFYLAISKIPLADALSLLLIAPIIVVIFSSRMLSEKISIKRLLCVGLGFMGTLLVIQPGFGEFNSSSLFALASGLCYAFYILYTRKLNFSSDPIISLSFTAIPGAIVMTLLLPFFWESSPDLRQILLMGSIGPVVILAHFMIIKAYQYAEASLLAPFHYFEIVSNVIISVLYFRDIPSIIVSIGIMCIITSGIAVNLNFENKDVKK